MLFLVSTPIGNLEDLSFRALAVLKEADLILCEDTRRTEQLLDRYALKKALSPYHAFNERKELLRVIQKLQEGQTIALVSDAGTPCLSDPGSLLIQTCIENNLPFTAIPGACSVIQALLLSGFETQPFQFLGFLERNPQKQLLKALYYPGTTLVLESPKRLTATLKTLSSLAPKREVAVLREMTKLYEESIRGPCETVFEHFSHTAIKGEIVLALRKGPPPEESLPLEDLIPLIQQEHGLSLKDALSVAAKLCKIPKRSVYQTVHKTKKLP